MAKTDPAAVRRQLDKVQRRLAEHPLNSDEFTRARALIKEMPDADRTSVEAALQAQGLPGFGRQTRLLLVGLPSLARLNRRRLRLEAKLGSHGSHG